MSHERRNDGSNIKKMDENQKMKVLAICGSPRRGNTYRSLKEMQNDHPDVDLKIIML